MPSAPEAGDAIVIASANGINLQSKKPAKKNRAILNMCFMPYALWFSTNEATSWKSSDVAKRVREWFASWYAGGG